MESENPFPCYEASKQKCTSCNVTVHVLTCEQGESVVPEDYREEFKSKGQSVVWQGKKQTHYLTQKKAKDFKITKETSVCFSEKITGLQNYYGIASDILQNAYKFSRKQKRPTLPKVHIFEGGKDAQKVLRLVQGRNQAKEWANGRGDVDGVPSFFEKQAENLAKKHNLKLTVIKGDDLVKDGFRLMHAVGRASRNEPIFINLAYNGNPDRQDYVAFVGKGVCFDAGGLDIKTAANMKDMYLDKHGACSVLAAFKSIVQEKIKINLTVSMGFVENFISENSYRPSDIIKSRKGLTVEIGNTDAEGRLVLADCMNWTQQNYKTDVMIELSTLTGAIIIALGHRFGGMFGNNCDLKTALKKAGKQTNEEVWQMPIEDYHRDLVRPKKSDLTNSSGKTEAGSSQAAAFLEHFVEEGVKWIHLDIAGVGMVEAEGSGYGAKILTQYARNYSQ